MPGPADESDTGICQVLDTGQVLNDRNMEHSGETLPSVVDQHLSNLIHAEPNNDTEFISQRIKNINTDNRFRPNSTGPFFIFVEHKYLNIGRLHPMRVGEKLLQIGGDEKHIMEINTVGKNRLKIQVDSATVANRLVTNQVFENNNLIAYIPVHLTEKKGVVRAVDTTYSEPELIDSIQSDVPIKSIRRMYKVIKDGDSRIRVARQMVIISFDSLIIPQHVYMNKIRFAVDQYYSPVLMCYHCLRYGHTSTQCRSKRKCRSCGADNDQSTVCINCNVYCIHCESNSHSSTDKRCPVFLKQKRIKQAMSNMNMSFYEAQKIVENPTYASLVSKNRFEPLLVSNTDFPSLPVPNTGNSQKSSASNIVHNSQPGPSRSHTISTPRKRKKTDTEPHFPPIRREYEWSFGGSPVINEYPYAQSFEDIKTRLVKDIQNNTPLQSIFNRNLNIVQWNARSAIANHNLLKNLISDTKADIVILSETWYKSIHNITLRGYNVIRKDRGDGKGGVAIFLRNNIPFKQISFENLTSNLEICGVDITYDNTNISVMSAYKPPNVTISTNDYIEVFSRLQPTSIVGGDFNGHHVAWGSSINNAAGNNLMDAIEFFSHLAIRNEGQATRLTRPGTNISVVDVTIISNNLLGKSKWSVLDDSYGSDHFPISLIINVRIKL
nr:unnamed protein product [Callosobruchus analis]